jgi:hypothetical protein
MIVKIELKSLSIIPEFAMTLERELQKELHY